MPKVTITVAVYNVGVYIEQCARSLFEQTLDDIEIIFVDDATPDDSVDIIERTLLDYPNRKEQVRILHHEHNMGISQTRKDGLNATTGEYLIFVDGDDWVEPNYAELLFNRAKDTGADIVMCNSFCHNPEGIIVCESAPYGKGENGERLRDDTLNRRCSPNLWMRMFKRSLYVENDIMWPIYGMAEDLVINTQLSYYAKKLAHVDVPLYHYRNNPTSYARSQNEEKIVKRTDEYFVNFKIIQEFMQQKGIAEKYENGLFLTKIEIRDNLFPLIHKPKYWWKIVSMYPEVNWIFLFGNKYHKPGKKERVWMLCILLGLFPLLKKPLNKYCFPGWRWWPQ